MLRYPGRAVTAMLLAGLVTASGSALFAAKFKSTWHAPGAEPLNFAGKKVVALVMTDDQSLEVSAEESLTRELTARGVQAVPAYRMIPREELRDRDKAKGWFTRGEVVGVVAMRLVDSRKQDVYTPSTWTTPYYGSFWNYYGYGWGSMYIPGTMREDTVVTVETLVFSVTKDKLLWAGVSEKTNPKTLQKLVADLVKESIKEMVKAGLVPKGAK